METAALTRASIQTDNGSHYVTFAYQLIGWSGNQPCLVANNLSTWDTSGNQIEQEVGSVGDGITETVTVRIKCRWSRACSGKISACS
jgi:hypothetical protein